MRDSRIAADTTRRAARYWLLVFIAFFIIPACSNDDDNPTQPQTGLTSLEQRAFDLINQHRASQGLAALTENSVITEQARNHSRNMANGTTPFSHEGFDQRIETIKQSITVRGGAENVAFNQNAGDPVQTAVNGWLNSPGHKANIQGDYNLTGMGVADAGNGKYYFTQIFIKSN